MKLTQAYQLELPELIHVGLELTILVVTTVSALVIAKDAAAFCLSSIRTFPAYSR